MNRMGIKSSLKMMTKSIIRRIIMINQMAIDEEQLCVKELIRFPQKLIDLDFFFLFVSQAGILKQDIFYWRNNRDLSEENGRPLYLSPNMNA